MNIDKKRGDGMRVVYVKATCKCGHVIPFLTNKFVYCRYCGRKVYPEKKSEFRDKVMNEIKKIKEKENE